MNKIKFHTLLTAAVLSALLVAASTGSGVVAQQPQPQEPHKTAPNPTPRPTAAVSDCPDVSIKYSTKQLAERASVVATGVVIGAGPGTGACHLPPVPPTADRRVVMTLEPNITTASGKNFLVVVLQCIHKGLVRCRNNPADGRTCVVLVEAPALEDSTPCVLRPKQRLMFFLEPRRAVASALSGGAAATTCAGHYTTTYKQIFHSVRRPLGGAGCTPYPCYLDPDDMTKRLSQECVGPLDSCDDVGDVCALQPEAASTLPLSNSTSSADDAAGALSPCAGDPTLMCAVKACPGKWMFHNAILPSGTCYPVYSYATSGFPTNCFGSRYLSYRLHQITSATEQGSSDTQQTAESSEPPQPAPTTGSSTSSTTTRKSTTSQSRPLETTNG